MIDQPNAGESGHGSDKRSETKAFGETSFPRLAPEEPLTARALANELQILKDEIDKFLQKG